MFIKRKKEKKGGKMSNSFNKSNENVIKMSRYNSFSRFTHRQRLSVNLSAFKILVYCAYDIKILAKLSSK